MWWHVLHNRGHVESGPQELVLRICTSLGYMPSVPQAARYCRIGSFPSVTLNPTFRPAGCGLWTGWSQSSAAGHCGVKDGCLQPPAALTQLLLGIRGWGRCCSHVVESGLEGSNILLPQQPCVSQVASHKSRLVRRRETSLPLSFVRSALVAPARTDCCLCPALGPLNLYF